MSSGCERSADCWPMYRIPHSALSVCLLLLTSSPKSAVKETQRIRHCRNAAMRLYCYSSIRLYPASRCCSFFTIMLHHYTVHCSTVRVPVLIVFRAKIVSSDSFVLPLVCNRLKQVAQLSQRNRAAAWASFGWVVDDGVGQ